MCDIKACAVTGCIVVPDISVELDVPYVKYDMCRNEVSSWDSYVWEGFTPVRIEVYNEILDLTNSAKNAYKDNELLHQIYHSSFECVQKV